ncbi:MULTISPECIES: type 4a pilus biogenesis protein PilO [unclassified Thioalkalivibrio]|uniref:type 4a pilus biogenesis protein PilO n=1 Tax=unclassified Thioalkalivibrio TaxID=2621013 RepID=UPI00036C02C1|nr:MULTISPECIES: type 4a pilus biogenesis protein PilO [unclassified Thioalkalivibrio]
MDLKNLNEIDFNNIGEAPWIVKGVILLVIIAVILGLTYYFVIDDQLSELERAEREEQQLRDEFEEKQQRAANLDDYREQLAEMEDMFVELLELLPTSAEIPSLLVDVSQTALQTGLEIELFEPRSHRERDFYAEVPIRLRLRGDYEELAEFVSGVSSMPRVVTMHDMRIRRAGDSDFDLVMNAEARTYRYLEDN